MAEIIKPYLVRDSDFQELIANYCSYVDISTKTHDFSAKFANIESPSQEVYDELIKSVAILKNLPDKEIEECLNIVLYIISDPLFEESTKKNDKEVADFVKRFEQLIEQIIDISPKSNPDFNDKVSIKFTSILSTLSVFFNLIEPSSSLRFRLLSAILTVFDKLDDESAKENAHLILPLTKRSTVDSKLFLFEKYLVECKTSDKEILSFTNKLSTLLAVAYPKESLVILKSISLKYKGPGDHITSLVVRSLATVQELDLTYLYKIDEISSNKGLLYDVLHKYTNSGNLQQFTEFVTSSSSEIEHLHVPVSTLLLKKQYLTIAELALKAAENSSYESVIEGNDSEGRKQKKLTNFAPIITYKQISDSLKLEDDLVKIESILINALRMRLFDGKIDEVKQVVSINKLNLVIVSNEDNSNKLGPKEWKFVLNSLKHWRKSLNEASGLIESQKKK